MKNPNIHRKEHTSPIHVRSTSIPDLYERSPDVFQSALKTKHKAIMLGSDDSDNLPTCKQRTKIKLYDLRQPHIDWLRHNLGTTHGVH